MADNKFFNLFNDIDEKYIKEAQLPKDGLDMYPDYSAKPLKRKIPLAIMGAAACAALIFGVVKVGGMFRRIETKGTVIASYASERIFYTLYGTPLPESELEEFNYEKALESEKEKFSEELTSALAEIGKPELTEAYTKAKTLAELTQWTDLLVTDAVKEKGDRAYITLTSPSVDPIYPDDVCYMYETGYRYDSFCRAFREVFGEDSADNMLRLARYGFCDYDGQLYCQKPSTPIDVWGLVHIDYEVVTNTDSEVVFNTVCYFDDADEWLKNEVREPYDPANKDTYINREGKRSVGTQTNRMIKTDGVWKAYDICYGALNQTLDRTFENSRPNITENYALDRDTYPSSVHTDYNYEEELSEYTEELKNDEDLTAFLDSLGEEFTEFYYRARTLAEILANSGDIYLNRSECMGNEIGTGISFYDEYNQVVDRYLEFGYKYDSFFDALHEVFGNDTVNYMLDHGTFYDYNNELFVAAASSGENPLLAHTEYELITHTDDTIAFDTVCYHILPEDYIPHMDRFFPYTQEYDPDKKSEYVVTRVNNLFVKVDGKWRAEAICFLGDLSSIGDDAVMALTDDRGNTFKITGTPLAESELRDFGYEGMLEYCLEMYTEDELLTELLDGLGKPEVTELYYRARTLADITAMRAGVGYETFAASTYAPEHRRAQITMLKDTPPSFYGTIDPSYTEGKIFHETCLRYDSFINALNDVFIEESAAWMLARYPFFYGYDGQLYCNRVTAGTPMNCVHTEYRLEENSADTVKFTTINYYVPFETFQADDVYDPDNKENYLTSEINNEFRLIDGEWKAYEVCMLVDCSSRGGRMFSETESQNLST
ncbi:MAG: hypothetical protein HDT43_09505 [Ruminococcaceae bacterium]|nr:hypothetical protein [Oscillospiraceae bacterium]